MLKKNIVSILILTLYLSSCLIIYNNKQENKEKKINVSNINQNNFNTYTYKLNNKDTNSSNDNNDIIGKLIINKINLTKDIYALNNEHNNVDENVTILKDDDNLKVLAAHSGYGNKAYFNDLDKLSIDDNINLIYKKKNFNYKIVEIEDQIKDGTIEIDKTDTKRLILTTCSKKDKNKQLVITSILNKEAF